MVSKLRKAFPCEGSNYNINTKTKHKTRIKEEIKSLPDINLDDYDIEIHSEDEIILSENSSNDEDDNEIPSKIIKTTSSPLWVLPLYSMLPAHKQKKVNLFILYIYD